MTTLDFSMDGRLPARAKARSKPQRENSFGLGGRVTLGLLLAAALVGACIYWGMTVVISGAVIAHGVVKVVDEVKTIQHHDGGIIAEIAVRQGDRVEAGQLLIRLDDAQTRAELAIIRGQLNELQARRARLLAERDGRNVLVFPVTFDDPSQKRSELMAGEAKLFAGNLLNRSRQKEQLDLQQQQLALEVTGLRAQLDALEEEIVLVEEEHGKLVELDQKGLIEGSRVAASNRELAHMRGQRGEIEASIARAGARKGEVALQTLAVDETSRNDAQRELRQVEALVAELEERLTATQDRLTRTDIRSPQAGIVNEVEVTTIGGIITPAATVVTIVPAEARLHVEMQLRTVDVDQMAVGRPARLRFSAFNARTTPEVPGTVTRLSAAAQVDGTTGETFYVADVGFDATDLGGSLELRPGMPVEVFVETEQMTPWAYIAKPFTDQIARAFREE